MTTLLACALTAVLAYLLGHKVGWSSALATARELAQRMEREPEFHIFDEMEEQENWPDQ